MSTETEKPTPESTGDPKARTRAEVQAKREEKREERRIAKADKAAEKEARAEEKKSAKADKASGASATKAEKTGKGEKSKQALPVIKGGVDSIRTLLGQVVWIVAVVCALFLAVGALCIALDANRGNELVDFVLSGADTVSLGIFSLEDGIKTFVGVNSDVKNALVNYGIGAVAYLVVGRVLDRVIRP